MNNLEFCGEIMRTAIIAAFLLLLGGCASDNAFEIPDQAMLVLPDVITEEMAKQEIKAALRAQKKVSEVGNEWRDTDMLIKTAQESLASKRYRQALILARRAKHQGINAYEQYKREEDAHERF